MYGKGFIYKNNHQSSIIKAQVNIAKIGVNVVKTSNEPDIPINQH